MIRFTNFLPMPVPVRTKVKFNIRDGDKGVPAYRLLIADHQGPMLTPIEFETIMTTTTAKAA